MIDTLSPTERNELNEWLNTHLETHDMDYLGDHDASQLLRSRYPDLLVHSIPAHSYPGQSEPFTMVTSQIDHTETGEYASIFAAAPDEQEALAKGVRAYITTSTKGLSTDCKIGNTMRFYPATQAARMAGISRENMNKRIKHGKVAAITKNGRHYVLDTTEPLHRMERLIKELNSDQYVPVKDVPIGAEFWRLADDLWLVHTDHAPTLDTRAKRTPRRYPNGSTVFTVTLSDPGWQALEELHQQWSARESGPIFRQAVIQQAVALLDETQFDPELAREWAAGYRVEHNKNRLVTRWTPDEYAQLERVQTWYEQRMSEAGIGAGRRWSLGTPGRGRLCDFALFMALRNQLLTIST